VGELRSIQPEVKMHRTFSCARACGALRAARVASAILLIPLAGACASYPKPASTVPGQLTDIEAARIADDYIQPRVGTAKTTTAIRPWENGWLVEYVTDAYNGARPPKESHLVWVKTDGGVHELTFRANQ
jgi:hypothetical protein